MPKNPTPFRPFDERKDVRVYHHGILPHWRQAGCTYFVTFRLVDSLPKAVLQQIEHERTLWLKARQIDPNETDWKHKFSALPPDQRRLYERLIGGTVNRSLDACHGSCTLRDPELAQIVAGALDHFHEKRVYTGDLVVMPNHVHALLTPMDGFELEDLLQSIKGHTARELNRATDQSGQFWQHETYDHIVRDLDQLKAYQQYIVANPSKANLRSGEYIHSPAEYYEIMP